MATSSEQTTHQQLLALQKATFEPIAAELRNRQRRENAILRRFRRRYDREVRSYAKISNKSELLKRVVDASIVYCGDYHTLRHAQRTAAKILRGVAEQNRDVVLGLEWISKRYQEIANQFVAGDIDEETFLASSHYNEVWGFPWINYRQIFDIARTYKFPILALNSELGDTMPLGARDDLAADLIVDAHIQAPERLIFCFYGDLHVAEPHIPRRVDIRLKRHAMKYKALTIFQNSEPIYWDLAERGLETTVDVVQISRTKFCVLSAPPWIKWQSYKSWLEDQSYLLDEPDEGDAEYHPDYYHQVLDLAHRIATFLKLSPPNPEQFSVITAQDVEIVEELKKHCAACHRRDFPIEAVIRSEIIENRSCFFPERSLLYLSDLSANRAAEKAAQLIAAKLDPEGWVYGNARGEQEIFYRQVLWEAIGFFGSKIINHKRKCDHYRDLERMIMSQRRRHLTAKERDRRNASKQVLNHRKFEKLFLQTGKRSGAPRKLYRLPPRQFFLAASMIGQILANRMYIAMISGDVKLQNVQELFSPVPRQADGGQARYWEFAKLVQSAPIDRESKEDRF